MKFYIRLIAVLAIISILIELFGGLGLYIFIFAIAGYILYHTKR